MTLPENSFKRTSLYVAATHVAFLVGLFVFSRLHFEVPFNPETVVWLDGGGGTGGDGVEAADAGAIPPTVPPRPGSEPDSEDLVLPPVNRVPTKTVVRPSPEEASVSPEAPLAPGKSEIQLEAKKPEVKKPESKPKDEVKKPEVKKPESKPKEEAKKPEVKKPESKPKEEAKKPEVKKPESKPKEEAKKPEVKKPENKPKEQAKKPEVKKPESKPQVVKSGAKPEQKPDSKSKDSGTKTEVVKATAVKSKDGDGKEIPKAAAAGSGGAIAKAVSAGGGVAKATAVGAGGSGGSGGKGGSPGSGGGSGGGQGTGVGRGVGAGREGGRPDAPDLGGYYRHIHDRFYQPWEQPKTLIRTGKALRVLLSLRIAKDGEILERKIVEGSGNEEMDKSVMVAANKVLKIDRLPDGVKKDPFEVSIEFKLDQN
jgi:TolA protein